MIILCCLEGCKSCRTEENEYCKKHQLHVFVKFPDPLSRRLVQLLDGTRDREMLTRDLTDYVRSGQAKLLENGVPVENPAEVAAILERRLHENLQSLAREGMLVS